MCACSRGLLIVLSSLPICISSVSYDAMHLIVLSRHLTTAWRLLSRILINIVQSCSGMTGTSNLDWGLKSQTGKWSMVEHVAKAWEKSITGCIVLSDAISHEGRRRCRGQKVLARRGSRQWRVWIDIYIIAASVFMVSTSLTHTSIMSWWARLSSPDWTMLKFCTQGCNARAILYVGGGLRSVVWQHSAGAVHRMKAYCCKCVSFFLQ